MLSSFVSSDGERKAATNHSQLEYITDNIPKKCRTDVSTAKFHILKTFQMLETVSTSVNHVCRSINGYGKWKVVTQVLEREGRGKYEFAVWEPSGQ
jgi:hypothetical protein